jgi:acyl dehydratase
VRGAAFDGDSLLIRLRSGGETAMRKQTYWDEVESGSEIPTLEKHPTTQQLVKYAGASGDFYQIHYDKDFALNNNLPGVIIHGALKNAFLGQMMTDFAGPEGWVRKLAVQYRGMDQPGAAVRCKGRVVKKYSDGPDRLVDCEIWLENAKGEKTTLGGATVVLPSRKS